MIELYLTCLTHSQIYSKVIFAMGTVYDCGSSSNRKRNNFSVSRMLSRRLAGAESGGGKSYVRENRS